ncbi:MAG: hypothetical protein JWO82_3123 [Akkermansiaceae bacterium]|nr:hypothetical protein [Akkermansiaceae bacterium]
MKAVREGKQIIVRSGDREILRYQAEAGDLPRPEIKEVYRRGGYLQSVFTPAGKLVTDDFAPNHLHHHAVWTSWATTQFEGRKPDFWNMGEATGRVDFVAVDEVWNKDTSAGFTARHQFVDMTAKPEKVVLLETWKVIVTTDGKRNIIDLVSIQNCATESPLKLPEYHYGGIGFRGNREWDGVEGCRFLTASGLTDRNKVNTAHEPWCWVGGKVGGETCGITFLGSPDNFRAPQPFRAHPSEPFFCFAPQQMGEMAIEPGKTYTASYRMVVTDGEPDAAAIGGWWKDYTAK